MSNCEHKDFQSGVQINQMLDLNGNLLGYIAIVEIRCAQCKLPFKAIGLPEIPPNYVPNKIAAASDCATRIFIPLAPLEDNQWVEMEARKAEEDFNHSDSE